MRKTTVMVLASVAAVFAFMAPVNASTRHILPAVPGIGTTYYHVCDSPDNLCLRDPSDGHAGTIVKLTNPPGDRSELWGFFQDTSICHGKIEPKCGFPSFLVNRYRGKDIVFFKQEVSGNCIKFSNDTNWNGVMGTCFDNNTLLIYASCNSGYCYFPSIEASEYFNTTEWMCGDSGAGFPPFAGTGCTDVTWRVA